MAQPRRLSAELSTRKAEKSMTVQLGGKSVVVMGASAGIGRSLTTVLVDKGASVVGNGRRPDPGYALEKEISKRGGGFTFIPADVSKTEDCERTISAAIDKHGRIDALINNAALMLPFRRVEEMSDTDWRTILDVTLDGVMKMSRAVLPAMQEQRDGTIISIASITAVQGVEREAAYSVAKAGVLSFTRVLAIENLSYGIRANAVIMGGVASEMSDTALVEMGRTVHGPDWTPDMDEVRRANKALLQDPDAVARSVVLLCSDDAREITGATIAIDRAWSAGSLTSAMLNSAAGGQIDS